MYYCHPVQSRSPLSQLLLLFLINSVERKSKLWRSVHADGKIKRGICT